MRGQGEIAYTLLIAGILLFAVAGWMVVAPLYGVWQQE